LIAFLISVLICWSIDLAVDAQLIEHVALVAEAAAKKHEDNKCSLVDSGCASQLVEGLRFGAVSSSPAAVQAVCGCLRSLTTADDPNPAASRWSTLPT
jgi:hypothetical protein